MLVSKSQSLAAQVIYAEVRVERAYVLEDDNTVGPALIGAY